MRIALVAHAAPAQPPARALAPYPNSRAARAGRAGDGVVIFGGRTAGAADDGGAILNDLWLLRGLGGGPAGPAWTRPVRAGGQRGRVGAGDCLMGRG